MAFNDEIIEAVLPQPENHGNLGSVGNSVVNAHPPAVWSLPSSIPSIMSLIMANWERCYVV
ncbi:MAG: hypothetical protein GY835_08680 [bacterium]|nr:hypothetical protein [bacterium]